MWRILLLLFLLSPIVYNAFHFMGYFAAKTTVIAASQTVIKGR